MAAPFARLEVWSDLAAAAGTRLAFIPDLMSLKEGRTLDGQDRITTELRRESDAWSQLRKERVLRVVFDDGTFDEWRISSIEEADKAGPLTGTVVAVSPLMDLARGFLERTEADGTAWPIFELLGLTPSTLISSVILPAAPSYFALGTVNPIATVDVTFEADTPLSALRALAQLTDSELAVRRNGTTNYLVDLLTAVGSGVTVTQLRVGKNVRGVVHQVLPDDHATRIYGVGGGEEDIRLTIAGARWKITAITGSDLTLADPAGGDAPLAYDNQLNGLYLRKEGAASSTLINNSIQSTQKVTVASTVGLAVNDTIAIEKNSAGDDLIYLEAPADKVTYGLVAGILKRPNLPNVRNFVANPQLNGTYAAGLPSNWVKVGIPTTAEETASLFTRYGGKSCKVTATADGQGIETAAITIAPTADNPHFSGFATFQIASGRVRVEVIDITNTRTWPDGTTGRAWSDKLNVWIDDLGVASLDLKGVNSVSVKLRIVADGGAATFYVDAAQLTQTAGQIPFFAGVGATQLWQAVNDELVKRSVPKESLDVDLIDLHRYDPTAWPYEELVLGGTVKIVHGDLGLDRSTRIVSWSRDLVLPMVTDVRLSNRPEDLTEATARPDRRRRLREGSSSKRPPPPFIPSVAIVGAEPIWRANRLFVSWDGDTGVASVKIATSTTSFPAAGTGTASDGQNGTFDAGTFVYGNTVFVTITPYPQITAGGTPGASFRLRTRLASEEGQFDETTGKRKRAGQYDDSGYALESSASDGRTAGSGVKESGGKAVNRLFAKALAADPDSLDSAADGVTYKKVAGVTAGNKVTDASIDGGRVRRHRHSNTTAIGTGAATAETDLMSHTLPTLADGDTVEFQAEGDVAGANAAKTVRIRLAGTAVLTISFAAAESGSWAVTGWIIKRGAVTDTWMFHGEPGIDLTGAKIGFNVDGPDASAAILKVTGQTANASDEVTAKLFIVTVTQQ